MGIKDSNNNHAGFTLVELLVVIGIIGILVAIAIPNYQSYRQRGYDAATLSDAKNSITLVNSAFEEGIPDYLCANTADCQTYIPSLTSSNSTSAICWEIETGELRRLCACSRKGSVRGYCYDVQQNSSPSRSNICPCPGEP